MLMICVSTIYRTSTVVVPVTGLCIVDLLCFVVVGVYFFVVCLSRYCI